MSDTYDHEGLKALAKSMGRPLDSLYALTGWHDPFMAGQPGRTAAAEWFAQIWQQLGLQPRKHHDRAIHYILISQPKQILGPDGTPYENTDRRFTNLTIAIRDARYLGLIPPNAVIDRRNPEAEIFYECVEVKAPEINCARGFVGQSEIDAEGPTLWAPDLTVIRPVIEQRFHIELWAEKTTMNGVLMPLAQQYRANVQTAAGEMSTTKCEALVDRALASGKPVRILYISDFDPCGRDMPVSASRKIEFLVRRAHVPLDIQLCPIVLTHDQCVAFHLPRTPIKETELRAGRFEAMFGEGATELDALEAIRPGELRRILVREIERYYDPTLERRIAKVTDEAVRDLSRISRKIRKRHAEEMRELESEREKIAAELAEMKQYIREKEDALAENAEDIYGAMEDELREESPTVEHYDWPEPREADEDPDPLYDSQRDYLEQVDRYRAHQGKEANPVVWTKRRFSRTCEHCGKGFEAIRPDTTTCSTNCRTKKWRKLNPDFDPNASRKRCNGNG